MAERVVSAEPARQYIGKEEVLASVERVRSLFPDPVAAGIYLDKSFESLIPHLIDVRQRMDYRSLFGDGDLGQSGSEKELLLGYVDQTPVCCALSPVNEDCDKPLLIQSWLVRVMGELGVKTFLAIFRARSLNPSFEGIEWVIIDDHINFLGDNPLVGPNVDAWGPRFPDMSEPYDPLLRRLAEEEAQKAGLNVSHGILAGIPGRYVRGENRTKGLRDLGADLFTAYIIPEVLVARHMGIRVLALSCIAAEVQSSWRERNDVRTFLKAMTARLI